MLPPEPSRQEIDRVKEIIQAEVHGALGVALAERVAEVAARLVQAERLRCQPPMWLSFVGSPDRIKELLELWYQSLPENPPPQIEVLPELDLVALLRRQMAFSERTFGPGQRTKGTCDHVRKELKEIEAAPNDVVEWADAILLLLDGAWRSGHTPEEIASAISTKLTINENRKWPDWRTMDPNKAIEHIRPLSGEGGAS